jgi:hypothetical protein
MIMGTIGDIMKQIQDYMNELDWRYIITFIIISYGINHYRVSWNITKITGKRIRTKYRMLIIGALYAIAVYFIRGYQFYQIERLFQSYIFALVFHKFIIEGVLFWLAKRALPGSIGKHILNSEQLPKIFGDEDK